MKQLSATPERMLSRMLLCLLVFIGPSAARGQTPVIDRGRGKEMLQNIKQALKEVYYDKEFHGINVDARFKEAEKQIDQAKSTFQINAIIAQTLSELDDSHTTFFPPDLVVGVNFGFAMQMIGDKCYIVHVKPESDAEKKGLKVGHELFAIDGYEPTRESLPKISYSYFQLLPPESIKLTVRGLDGQLRDIVVAAAISNKKPRKIKANEGSDKPPQYFELGDVIVCKLPEFDLNDNQVDEMMKRISKAGTLILDLRRNPGGYVDTVKRMLGYFFDKDVKVGDEKRRSKTTPVIAKARGEKMFAGKVFVLIDSKSASGAEVFARVMQLEKRGTVVGDRSSGAVMESVQATFPLRTSASWQAIPRSFYGASITIADLLMSDNKSLEKTGVLPDVVVLPTAADLAAKRDPVLAHAATLAGAQLDAGRAGRIFPSDIEVDESKDKSQDSKDNP
jgi:C-terminal processing protease CtpA/Prc